MGGTGFGPKGKLSMYFGFLVIASIIVIPAYADQVIQPTSGGTIDVGFATDPASPTPGGNTNLQISFVNKSTHAIQQHIDYKVAVMEGSSQICGTQILHTAEGSVTIPCQFPDAATYQVVVEVDGILFQPIPPETATFTVNLGGGNSSGTTGINSTIVIPSWIKNTAKWWSQSQVGDQDFVKGIQYLIQQKIMQVPLQSNSSATSGASQIPSWIKTNARWWASGQISDQDFVKGIQWLVSNGIIVV
ncbi:MAG: hypothetical protein KGH89_05340 [Thaumarchaeota archaeon]|nr:hypothetical protein [Nitrososphaerota archaeon]MDE1866231.1 hypothetical protein [Nitrososphaerota archaeon]